MDPPALRLGNVVVERHGAAILAVPDWEVRRSERWVVLGPNGSGKTTLMQVAAGHLHPTGGDVEVLGERLGRTDVRVLRRRIGYVSSALAAQLRGGNTALDVVITAKHAALEPWWHHYDDRDRARARECLARFAVGHLEERTYATLSSGEQQRVLLARAFFTDPAFVLLDEPAARLDLGGREDVVRALAELASTPGSPPLVLVTHHVDEIPIGFTHTLLLAGGRVVSGGPIERALTSEALTAAFGLALVLERRPNGRLAAWAA